MTRAYARLALALGSMSAAAWGCERPAGPLDAGGDAPGLPPLPTCAAPLELIGEEGRTVIAQLDTTGGLPGEIDFGDCGPSTRGPQAVIAYRVPGIGPHAVTVSTDNTGTDRTFDTALLVRRETCREQPVLARERCFDDQGGELRARGTIFAQGGETVFVIVTSYPLEGAVAGGPVRVEIIARVNHPPAIEAASVLLTPAGVRVEVRANDEDRDGWGVLVTFHGPAREVLDTDGDGDADFYDGLLGPLDRSVTGAMRWRETATFERPSGPIGGASEAWVRAVDDAREYSTNDVAVPVRMGVEVGAGEACSPTRVCALELECRDASCQTSADRAAACAAATPIPIVTPVGTATTASADGVLMPGDGVFSGSCSSTGGREMLYRIDVPDGARYDVLASTDNPRTGAEVDTVLYARTDCGNPATEPMSGGCHDDIDYPGDRRSEIEVRDAPAGPLTIFVEHFRGVPADREARFGLDVLLRPVLAAGDRCDPEGRLNRCADGSCSAGSRTCVP